MLEGGGVVRHAVAPGPGLLDVDARRVRHQLPPGAVRGPDLERVRRLGADAPVARAAAVARRRIAGRGKMRDRGADHGGLHIGAAREPLAGGRRQVVQLGLVARRHHAGRRVVGAGDGRNAAVRRGQRDAGAVARRRQIDARERPGLHRRAEGDEQVPPGDLVAELHVRPPRRKCCSPRRRRWSWCRTRWPRWACWPPRRPRPSRRGGAQGSAG